MELPASDFRPPSRGGNGVGASVVVGTVVLTVVTIGGVGDGRGAVGFGRFVGELQMMEWN